MYLTHATGITKLSLSFTILQALGLPDLINLVNMSDKCTVPLAHLPHDEAGF